MQENISKDKVHVGKVIDAHGIKGDIYCLVFSGDSSWISKLKSLNLRCEKNEQTKDEFFVVRKIKAFKKGFIVSLEAFGDRNRAESFKGCEVWVDSSLFISKNGESLYLSELLNFRIVDEVLGEIGTIKSFSSNAWQDLLVVSSSYKSNEVDKNQLLNRLIEIPFVKEFVTNIDYKNKYIYMSLPEGLLDINQDSVLNSNE